MKMTNSTSQVARLRKHCALFSPTFSTSFCVMKLTKLAVKSGVVLNKNEYEMVLNNNKKCSSALALELHFRKTH